MASIKVAAMMLLGMLLLASVSYAQEFEQPQFGESDADIAPEIMTAAEPEAAAGYGFDAVGPQDMMAQRRRLQTFLRYRYQPFPWFGGFFGGGFPYGRFPYGGYPYGNFGYGPYGNFGGNSATATAAVTRDSASASGAAVGK